MPETSHLKLKKLENLLTATHSRMFRPETNYLRTVTRYPFKDLSVRSVDPLKEFRTQTAETARVINSLKPFTDLPVNPLKEFRTISKPLQGAPRPNSRNRTSDKFSQAIH
jgi:hypothetical protein